MTDVELTPQGRRFAELLASAEDGVVWLARGRAAECGSPVERDRLLRDELAPLVARLGPVAREQYAKTLSQILSVSQAVVRRSIKEAVEAAGRGPDPISKAELPKGGAGEALSSEDGGRRKEDGGDDPDGRQEAVRASLEEFSLRHFKVWFGAASYVGRECLDDDGRHTVQFVTAGDLTRYYSHVRLPVWSRKREAWELKEIAKLWLDWPLVRLYERVVFKPDAEVDDDTYNLWRGFDVQPAPGDCSLYWRHVREVICSGDEEVTLYVRRWLAHAVQRVDELPEVALVLRGLQGTGKGWFVRPLLNIFGSHGLTVHSMEHVSGRFNAHLKDVVLLFADEAFWGGDRAREGLIKSLVTERKRLVEPKNKDAQQVDAYTRLIVATNTEWPLAMDHDDRRILVLDVQEDRKEDAAWFGPLAEQMKNGGTAALLAELLAEDLTGWNPRAKPQRGAGFDIKLRSASSVAQWWHECLVSESNQSRTLGGEQEPTDWWEDCPKVDELHGSYRRWCERLGRKYIESRESWARELRRLVPHLGVYRGKTGTGARSRNYKLDTLERCRTAFEAHFRVGAEVWDDPTPGGARDGEAF